MSLPNKISSVVFTVLDGATEISATTLSVSNLVHPWEMVFWDGRKSLSVTGKKRKKGIVRGFDSRLEFEWSDVKTQEAQIISLLEDMKTATDLDYDIRFNVEGDTDYLFLVPNSAIYNQNYINQIRRTPTTIQFELEQIQDDISYA